MRAENLIAVTGGAGVGKTTRILADSRYEAVVTYTNAVAENAARRGDGRVRAQTIYKLAWPHLRRRSAASFSRREKEAAYASSPVSSSDDPNLRRFERDAPSKKPEGEEKAIALLLHGWEEGVCPVDLAAMRAERQIEPGGPLSFAMSLAEFLEDAESDPTREKPYGVIAGDEWQDFSALEVRVALALADEVHGYGDPCQAIFSTSKGNPRGQLPFGWRAAREVRTLRGGGHRCGDPLASAAGRLMRGWYPVEVESFRARHETEIVPWDAARAPERGLVMGWRREQEIGATFRRWGLTEKWVRMGEKAEPDMEVVLATIHNAKGFEADDCYLLPWPIFMERALAKGDAEARKLCYTALTRAKRRAFVPESILAAMEMCGS